MGHNFEHFYLGINVINDDPSTRQLLIERLLRLRQRMFLAFLNRYQTPRMIILNALIATVRHYQHCQTDRPHQQTRLAQGEIMNTARCLIHIVYLVGSRVYKDLRLVGVPLFLAGIPLFLIFLDD